MSAKDIENFFRKISGSRKSSQEKLSSGKDLTENITGDPINSVKIDAIQERSLNFVPLVNIASHHKLRHAIVQVFDPVRPKSENLIEQNVSPACTILDRFNKKCKKEDLANGGQAHLEDASSITNSSSIISSSITSSQTSILPVHDEDSSDDITITDQSFDRTVIDVYSPSFKKKYPENLIDFSFVDSEENEINCECSKVSFAATSLISPKKINQQIKTSSLYRYSEDPVREKNILSMQLKVENEIYHEKLEMINEENESVTLSIETCAKKLDKKMAELRDLKSSYDEMKMHFVKLQDAFSDVYSKYNNAKETINSFSRSEQRLLESQVKVHEDVKTYTKLYNELHDNLIMEVNELNTTVWNNRYVHKLKLTKLETTLKILQKKEIRLKLNLAQKARECQEVAGLCKNANASGQVN